ncbi:MAG: phospholipase D-like domain-containing protein [bacterium]|jgi:phosphatidylserine/phosphatidylglycerophosphate/cardiolipin synthase-like enzyme
MDKRGIIAGFVVVAAIVVAAVVFLRITGPPVMRAAVLAADDRSFFTVVHELLSNAEESVDVVLYQSRFYINYPNSKSNVLIADLADASERGVRVRAVLELAAWNVENSEANRDVWTVLRDSGVEVYYDPADKTSHSKLIIIDGRYAVVGSSNWSYYSLDQNHEANVVINSKEVAERFGEFFEGVIRESSEEYHDPVEQVSAREAMESEDRYVLIRDLPRHVSYDEDLVVGFIEFDGATVTVSDSDLERVLALYPEFFEEAPDETLRVLTRVRRNGVVELAAIDIERTDTPGAMLKKLDEERAYVKTMTGEKPDLSWYEAERVLPVPNEYYVGEVNRLIESAEERIWVAMLNAVYYTSTPSTARRERAEGEVASYTNLIVEKLEAAARRGVEVRVVVDVGGSGTPSRGEDRLLERLGEAGARVYVDSPETTVHAKLMIVDDDYAVVGSTNWTYHAVEENNETAAIIESGDLNAHYAEFIEARIEEGTPYVP